VPGSLQTKTDGITLPFDTFSNRYLPVSTRKAITEDRIAPVMEEKVMRVGWRRHAAIFVCTAAVSLVSLPSPASDTTRVRLLSNGIQLETSSVKAGTVIFEVTNTADHDMKHELVVLKTDLGDDRLPVKNGQVPENRFKKMGETEDLPPGKSARLTLKLSPGHYVLICNKVGHYSQGMHAALIVIR
jgi:uncharacterized cupredoxin-like copper-binding protein